MIGSKIVCAKPMPAWCAECSVYGVWSMAFYMGGCTCYAQWLLVSPSDYPYVHALASTSRILDATRRASCSWRSSQMGSDWNTCTDHIRGCVWDTSIAQRNRTRVRTRGGNMPPTALPRRPRRAGQVVSSWVDNVKASSELVGRHCTVYATQL